MNQNDKARDLLFHRTSMDGKLVYEARPVYNQQKKYVLSDYQTNLHGHIHQIHLALLRS
jgi:hypothetical protein